MTIIEKPKFVYTGTKDKYDVIWYNTNLPNTRAKLDKNGNFYFAIVADGVGRIESVFKTPMAAVEFAKKQIMVKSLSGQRTYAQGKARIYWVDEISGKEYGAAVVIKNTKRYYEPVSRFDHSKDE